jgi:hypothetical protein
MVLLFLHISEMQTKDEGGKEERRKGERLKAKGKQNPVLPSLTFSL